LFSARRLFELVCEYAPGPGVMARSTILIPQNDSSGRALALPNDGAWIHHFFFPVEKIIRYLMTIKNHF
jgi:hypothetical protein